MKKLVTILLFVLLSVPLLTAQELGSVIITEIMYNAASSELTNETQYIEIANTTGNPISLLNWTIDDEDTDGPNTLPDVTLPAYGIAVICGSSAADFQGAWGTGYIVISLKDDGQTMFNLSNSPGPNNEVIKLKDASGTLIDSVDYDDTAPWPVDNGQSSIYLSIAKDQMNATSNNDGANWSNSSAGVDGAFESTPTGVWDAIDVGSPGNILGDNSLPVELTSFTATTGNGSVTLKWSTASEINNQGFVILRSTQKEQGYNELASYVNEPSLKGAGNSSHIINYTFTDRSVINGTTYWYKLVDVDMNGLRSEHGPVHATPKATAADPADYSVPQAFFIKNYPNPFNPSTTIVFDLSSFNENEIPVNLTIYDVAGEKILTLFEGNLNSQMHLFTWNGKDANGQPVPSGLYFYTFQSPVKSVTKKMILTR